MAFPVEIGAALATGGLSAIGSLGSALFSQGYNEKNMSLQAKYAKDLMDYQWQNYSSPKALMNAYTAAGVNPTSVFGHGNAGVSSPSVNMPSSAPVSVPNVLDLSALSSYIKSVADAKKAGMDTKLSEQEIKNKEVQRQSEQFDLDLKKQFGSEFKSVELAQAYRNLLLSSDSHDLNVQEKALNDWKIASEKAISEIKESEREIMKQTLDNNPTVIRLENALREEKIKSEKAGQAASYASAEASRAQAGFINSQKVEQEFFNEVRNTSGVKESFVKQMREFGNQAQREGWLTYWQIQAAEHAAQQAAYADDMKQYTYWINQINSVISTAAGAGAAFGALKHFNMLDKALGQPKVTTTENYNAFGEMSGRSVSTTQ